MIEIFQKFCDYYASSNINIKKKIRNITNMSYFKKNVNPSKRVGMDGVFFGLAGLLLGKPCPSLLFYLD